MIEEVLNLTVRRDDRGDVVDFGDLRAERFHMVSLRSGAVRGNHAHDRDEVVCVIGGSGKCEVAGEDPGSRETRRIVVEEDFKMYRVKSGIKHTIRNLGGETFYLVCFYDASSSTR